MASRKKKAASKSKPPRNRKKGAVDVRPKPESAKSKSTQYNRRMDVAVRQEQAPKSWAEFGDLSLDIILCIMDLLGWEGSVCLGLSCPEMYQAYKRLYPLKVPLRNLVDTTLPSQHLQTQIQLYKLIQDWSGIGDKYSYWACHFTWGSYLPKSMYYYPSRFLFKSVYEDDGEFAVSRSRLRRRYEDYHIYSMPSEVLSLPAYPDWLIPWAGGDDSWSSLLKKYRLPNPYNVGQENWEKEATKVIKQSIEAVRDRSHWNWFWSQSSFWGENYDHFERVWAAHHADISWDAFSEWRVMSGF
ncbi:hypothetical protein NHQ30_011200 [Ciborinia camelliae]|nr:hypothetical protein NHQ30_011200 [Ciborinia camelliae]